MEKPSRIVRCPKCHALLREPTCGISLYKCGNCSTTLRAKNAHVRDVHERRNTPTQNGSGHGSAPADYVTKHATPEDGHDCVNGALSFVDSSRPPNLKIETDHKFLTSESGNASQTSERASGDNSEDDLSTFSPTKALAARRNTGPLYKKRESPETIQTGWTSSHVANGTLYRGRSPPQITVELDTFGRQVSDLVITDEDVELSHNLLKPSSGQLPNRKLITESCSTNQVIEEKGRFSEEYPTSCRPSQGNNLTTRRSAYEVTRGKDRPAEEDLTSFRSEMWSRRPFSQEALVGSERSEDDLFMGHPVQHLQTPSRGLHLEEVIGIHKRLESRGGELFFNVAGKEKRATSRQPRAGMVMGSSEENSSSNSWGQPKGTGPMRQDQEVIVNKCTSFEEKQEFAANPQVQGASMFIKPVYMRTRQLAPPANLALSPPGSPLQPKLKSMNGRHAQLEFLPQGMYEGHVPLVDESSEDSADMEHMDSFHSSIQERCSRPQSEELEISIGNQKLRERTLDENSLQVKSDTLSFRHHVKVEDYEERALDQGSLGTKSNVQSSAQRFREEEYEQYVAQKTWDEVDIGCPVASGFSDIPQSVPPHQSLLRSPESLDNDVFQACKPGQVDSRESSCSFVVGRACQKQEAETSSAEQQSTSAVRLRINTAIPERILVVCKHCRVRLEVPPKLPISKAGHHKLCCGACWKISRFRLDHLLLSSGTSSIVRTENLSPASSFCLSQSPGMPSGRGSCSGTHSMRGTGHHVVRTNSGATVPLPHSTRRHQHGTSGSKLSNTSTAAIPSSVPSQTSTPSTSGNLIPPEELLQGPETSDDLSPSGDDEPSHASHSLTLPNASQDIYTTLADRQHKPSQERKILQSSSDSEEEKASTSVNREPAGPIPSPMNWAMADLPEFDDGHERKGIKGFLKKSVKVVTKSKKANQFRRKVVVNGHAVPDDLVRRAEEHAGPIHPGSYWYDMRAGFWGVMGGPCLGMIPPFIDELNYQMVRHCSNGKTGVSVNGRELHHKDLELLKRRGLPGSPGKQYNLDIDGRLIDAVTGHELNGLGRLAPTLEHTGRGPGMWVPESSRGS